MITQEQLKDYVHYDPETGIFMRRKDAGANQFGAKFPRWKAGQIMGSVTKRRGDVRICAFGKMWAAHRLAWLYHYGQWPEKGIDHINGNPTDNRICNLRDVSQCDNARNMSISTRNKTGMNGVHCATQNGKFVVQIRINGKPTHVGVFDDFFEAACSRKSAEMRLGYHPNHGRAAKVKG